MKLLTNLRSTPFTVLISLVSIIYNRNFGLFIIINLLISQAFIQSIKRLVDRPRPYKTLEGAIAINPPKCKYSLPSGHSSSALIIALALSNIFLVLRIVFLVLAIGTGVSRIYLGCHYPTDVALGFVISTFVFVGTFSF